MSKLLERLNNPRNQALLRRQMKAHFEAITADTIGEFDSTVASPEILAGLARALSDKDDGARTAAAEAIGRLGSAAVVPEMLSGLAHLLAGERSASRAAAAEAIGNLGPAAATPEILAALARTLCDEDAGIRATAAETVARLGAAAATPEIIALLVEAARGHDSPSENFRARPTRTGDGLSSLIRRILMPPFATVYAERRVAAQERVPTRPSGWRTSGSLSEGLIEYQIDRDTKSGDLNVRFGSRGPELENLVLLLIALPASTNKARGAPQQSDHHSWRVELQRRGADQVGGRIRIPRDELPKETSDGIELIIQVVERVK